MADCSFKTCHFRPPPSLKDEFDGTNIRILESLIFLLLIPIWFQAKRKEAIRLKQDPLEKKGNQ